MNRELPDAPNGFRKGKGTRDQIANIRWIIKKAREFKKAMNFCLIQYSKAFGCVDHNKLWEILQEMGKEGMQDLHEEEHEDEIEYDEHVWTSPRNAMAICRGDL